MKINKIERRSIPQRALTDTAEGMAVNAAIEVISAAVGSGTPNRVAYYSGTGVIGSLADVHVESNDYAIEVIRSGSGQSGFGVHLTNASNAQEAVQITHDGTGPGLVIAAVGTGKGIDVSRDVTGSTNPIAVFSQAHSGSSGTVISITQNGTGGGILITHNGGNNASVSMPLAAMITNSANQQPAIYGQTNGIGAGVLGANSSSGNAMQGDATGSGHGVYGNSSLGSGNGVYGRASTGISVYGLNTSSGYVGRFTRNSSTGAAAAVLIDATNSSDGQPALHVTHAGTSGTSGHAVKVAQSGTGKAGEFVIANASNGQVVLDAATNGTGIVLKAITTGAGRAGYFEANRTSPTDPVVEIKVANTSDTGVGLRINGMGTGSMLEVQDNGTNVLEIKDGGLIGVFNATPVGKGAALTAEDTSTVDATYGTAERDVINNIRTRLGELELRIKDFGIIN